MYTVEEARAIVLERVSALPAERVDLLDALGRVLAENLVSDVDVAPFDNSAMDGYAVRAEDTRSARPATPAVLSVSDEIAAGSMPSHTFPLGSAARIMTGAPLPEDADAVVMVENTEPLAENGRIGGTVAIMRPVRAGENVRLRGEAFRAGSVVLSAGEIVTPAAVGMLSSCGNLAVQVHRRPRVAILSTGSELVEASTVPGPGQLRNSNTYSLAAQVKAAGGEPVLLGIVADGEEATRAAILRACAEADVVVSSGGVCVGDFDFVNRALDGLAEVAYSKIRMRPASYQVHAVIGGVPYFGLPGNPAATFVAFELLVRPLLRAMQGFSAVSRPVVRAVLAQSLTKKPSYSSFLRGMMTSAADEDGWIGYRVGLAGGQSASLISTMHHANCFIVLPENQTAFPAGTLVDCMRLDVEEGTA